MQNAGKRRDEQPDIAIQGTTQKEGLKKERRVTKLTEKGTWKESEY